MDRGTYAAASGGLAQFRKLEIVNNNLANINTPGFKREILVNDTEQFDQTLAKAFEKQDPFAKGDFDRTPGVVTSRAVTDFTPGPIQFTGNPLDAALRKQNQFFVIQGAQGEEYTRAGDFTLDATGTLVASDGAPVLGDGGPIVVTSPGATITPSGAVKAGQQVAGKVRVVEVADTTTLERAGASRFKVRAGGAQPVPVDAGVEPQSIEMANVSAVSSVLDMIAANRGFEMYTKTAQSIDQLNQSAVQEIGRTK